MTQTMSTNSDEGSHEVSRRGRWERGFGQILRDDDMKLTRKRGEGNQLDLLRLDYILRLELEKDKGV